RGAMARHGPGVERQQHGAIAARHRRRRQRQEVVDLLHGARAAAGEPAPLGHRRARYRGQGGALTRAQAMRARVGAARPGADFVEHDDTTLPKLVGPFNRVSSGYWSWMTESFAVTSVCGGLRLIFLRQGLVP